MRIRWAKLLRDDSWGLFAYLKAGLIIGLFAGLICGLCAVFRDRLECERDSKLYKAPYYYSGNYSDDQLCKFFGQYFFHAFSFSHVPFSSLSFRTIQGRGAGHLFQSSIEGGLS